MNLTGKIKWINHNRGYGFITGDDGEDYFFHINNVDMTYMYPAKHQVTVDFKGYIEEPKKGQKRPEQGDRVQFVPCSGKKGKVLGRLSIFRKKI